MMVNSLELGSEIFRACIILAIFGYLLWLRGRARQDWSLFITGFGLLVLGNLIEISEESPFFDHSFFWGPPDVQVVLEEAIAFSGGYLLVLIGLLRLVPRIHQLSGELVHHKQIEHRLENQVEARLSELRAANANLEASIAAHKQTQTDLELARARLQHLLTASPAIIYSCEVGGDYAATFISDNIRSQMGYEPSHFIEDPNFWINRVHPEDKRRVLTEMEAFLQRNEDEHNHEYRFQHQDGSYRWVYDELRMVRDADNHPVELVGYWIDITERKQAEQTQQRLSTILEASTDFVGFADTEDTVEYINPAGCQLVGVTLEEAVGQPIYTFSPDWANTIIHHKGLPEARRHGWWRGETALLHREGYEIPVSQLILAHHTSVGEPEFFSTVARDIREEKAYQAQLEYQANYDHLTGLPNRNLLRDRLTHALPHAERVKRHVAVLFLDLDRFKLVNDSLGHDAGDALLQAVAERLKDCVRKEDTVSRLGGDEFVLMLEELPGTEVALTIAQKVLTALQAPFTLERQTFCINTSIGISHFPQDGEDAPTLIKSADIALHWAKDQGRGCVRSYTAEMNAQVVERLTLEQSLRQALDREEFTIHYQPMANLQRGNIVAVEALLRWRHSRLGDIPPAKFVPLAEELGIMPEIGEWVLSTACSQVRHWQDSGLPALTMSVNLSTQQFIQANLTDRVAQLLEEVGLLPSYLALEITESQIMQDVEGAIAPLKALKNMKVNLSIDEFGTGYSSLSQLKRFPLNRLKIGRDFIRDVTEDSDDAMIVKAIIALAQSLGLKVVAEGVETEEQMDFLREYGCEEIQGYYFSPPLPAEDIEVVLRENCQLQLSP